ncbi:putative IclR-family regulatory protein [Pseudooceanicola batsensis HTCC2597]|uniref:Putative IclR-family regulatory protein n=1 Tax=Pseudooceanicola batsensis (strain ATCC BAA-863 / DSM 15984 / KCTC 12145 / HTCC2597) TaxID=252305 RepID=A3U0V3_PSEBH|nr:IclR family transcriptional regulator [Pseudooceanicola batsensis]EAQ02394.1 putative IclR-family regulatory protein [Pseudooceanicola batsensis HTCC2597]
MPENGGASVQTIDRAASVLRVLASGPSEGLRLADVTAAVGLGKATAHRLLHGLLDVGFVELDTASKRYALGYELFVLGAAARRFQIVDMARPALARLAAGTGDTVYLSVRDGDQALCVDRSTGHYPIRTLTLDVGDRRPLGVGAGSLALLAFQDEAEIARILRDDHAARSPFERFAADRLRDMIRITRATGHAFNDGYIVGAMAAVGVPVLDETGKAVAALSIAAIRERMQEARRAELAEALRSEADRLSRMLATNRPDETGAEQTREELS